MFGISWLAEDLLVSQGGLCSVELVSYVVSQSVLKVRILCGLDLQQHDRYLLNAEYKFTFSSIDTWNSVY